VNEPTEAGVAGTNEILRHAEDLTEKDLCICLISGGGSALLPAPIPGITLDDKQEVTRFLSESGATIQELNTVRKQISRIKGGGLKSLCSGKRLVSLILSDVLGDPLDVIASGPTIDNLNSPQDALEILLRFAPDLKETQDSGLPRRVALRRIVQVLNIKKIAEAENEPVVHVASQNGYVQNLIIGNNALAVASANAEALRRGYSSTTYVSTDSSDTAEETGVFLAKSALEMQRSGSDCLIHGGEPVVKLAPPEIRGKGGRNQQLVLAALNYFLEQPIVNKTESFGIAFLSGGTDGEDGPTDAAGAWFDPLVFRQILERKRSNPDFDVADYLQRNDAYHFFEPLGTLLKTGPTGTNVCDIRIVLVER
jgi:glycerate-2-kinase